MCDIVTTITDLKKSIIKLQNHLEISKTIKATLKVTKPTWMNQLFKFTW